MSLTNFMLNFFKKKQNDNLVSETIKLKRVDCPSCAVDIDLMLEETKGVISAKTNYAKSETKVTIDKTMTNLVIIKKLLLSSNYL